MALAPGKRLLVGGVVLASILSFALLILLANRTDYRPLFTNLASEDAGEIVKKIERGKNTVPDYSGWQGSHGTL